jgi:ubiquitin C-terminal hydrolase
MDKFLDSFPQFKESFEFDLANTKFCDCGEMETTYEGPNNSLQIGITDKTSILDSLDDFVDEEDCLIEEGAYWDCPKCQITSYTKQIKLVDLPQMLMIELKRWKPKDMGFEKDDGKVELLDEIDMAPFLFSEVDGSTHYKLMGVIVHSGKTKGGGHYYSYVRLLNRRENSYQWIKFDDHVCSVVGDEEVLNCQGYVLFYEKFPEDHQLERSDDGTPNLKYMRRKRSFERRPKGEGKG